MNIFIIQLYENVESFIKDVFKYFENFDNDNN